MLAIAKYDMDICKSRFDGKHATGGKKVEPGPGSTNFFYTQNSTQQGQSHNFGVYGTYTGQKCIGKPQN